jgi:hypothetical protein
MSESTRVGKCELHVLTKQLRIVLRKMRISDQATQSRHVVVRQELRGLLGQEARRDQHIKLLASVKIEHVANAVEHFSADPASSRFKPAEGAPIDLGKMGRLLLCESALFAKMR